MKKEEGVLLDGLRAQDSQAEPGSRSSRPIIFQTLILYRTWQRLPCPIPSSFSNYEVSSD